MVIGRQISEPYSSASFHSEEQGAFGPKRRLVGDMDILNKKSATWDSMQLEVCAEGINFRMPIVDRKLTTKINGNPRWLEVSFPHHTVTCSVRSTRLGWNYDEWNIGPSNFWLIWTFDRGKDVQVWGRRLKLKNKICSTSKISCCTYHTRFRPIIPEYAHLNIIVCSYPVFQELCAGPAFRGEK